VTNVLGNLVVHGLRSVWSAEATLVSQTLEDLHMEASRPATTSPLRVPLGGDGWKVDDVFAETGMATS
jgi:hypothetical protein